MDRTVLLVSGSTRSASVSTAALRTARAVAPAGIVAVLYTGLTGLPHFNPDQDAPPLPPAVAQLRASMHEADAVMFSTPEYAGALPGSFKNLLDWTIGDDAPGSIYTKPAAWINPSPRGAADAYASLRKVLGYAHASIVESACVQIPVTTAMVGTDGLIGDPSVRASIAAAVSVLAASVDGAGQPAGARAR